MLRSRGERESEGYREGLFCRMREKMEMEMGNRGVLPLEIGFDFGGPGEPVAREERESIANERDEVRRKDNALVDQSLGEELVERNVVLLAPSERDTRIEVVLLVACE